MKNVSCLLAACVLLVSSCRQQGETSAFVFEEATIRSTTEAYKSGLLTSVELVSYYLERIERYDSTLGINSIVVANPMALEEAAERDRFLKSGSELPPLHGIPVIVKDNFNTAGLQTTGGSAALKGYEPQDDSWMVKKLRDAGAIVLAKSNMAEWAFSPMVTISSIAGETANPYNLDFVPAGSSGGTAAAVAANFGLVGLGTDTGNSIRGPSSHNALVGFRTTMGLIGRSGIIPLYLRNDVAGPMTRTVEDAVIMLNVLAGEDPGDPLTRYSANMIPEDYTEFLDPDGLHGARIGVFRALIERGIDPEIEKIFNEAIADLERLGAEIIYDFGIEQFEQLSSSQWAPAFCFDLENWLDEQGESVPVKSLKEIIDLGNYSEYIEDNLLYFLEHPEDPATLTPPALDPYTDIRRISYREAIEHEMDRLKLDAIIYPSWNYPPAHIGKMEEDMGDNVQGVGPHTGQPAFTVPMGFNRDGLPAGLQFLGRSFDEATLIRLVYAYEQGTMKRKAPLLEIE